MPSWTAGTLRTDWGYCTCSSTSPSGGAEGPAARRAPIIPENSTGFPDQFEKPTLSDATVEAPSTASEEDADDSSAEPALA